MRCSVDRTARRPRLAWFFPAVAGCLLVAGPTTIADGQDAADVTAVEEDWELIVKEPDEETQAPQVTCVMAPTADDQGVFAVFHINHNSLPQYVPGGLHLQVWNEDVPLDSAVFTNDALLRNPNEVVTWTTRMKLHEGNLVWEVVDGASTTWGEFGNDGSLRTTAATDLDELSTYTPAYSAANSGVGYAGNRVTSLKLLKLRYVLRSGDIVEDNQSRTIYPHN